MRGVTALHSSPTSPGPGRTPARTSVARERAQTCCQSRPTAPYSWFETSTSSPGPSGSERATTFIPEVAFVTKARSSGRAPIFAGEPCFRLLDQPVQPARQELDGLAFELSLPPLVLVEHRPGTGTERTVVEEHDLRVEQEEVAEPVQATFSISSAPPSTRSSTASVSCLIQSACTVGEVGVRGCEGDDDAVRELEALLLAAAVDLADQVADALLEPQGIVELGRERDRDDVVGGHHESVDGEPLPAEHVVGSELLARGAYAPVAELLVVAGVECRLHVAQLRAEPRAEHRQVGLELHARHGALVEEHFLDVQLAP